MKTIKNTKKSVMEIAQILARNEQLLKLLLLDTPDLSGEITDEQKSVDWLLSNNYISIYPIVDNGIKDTTRNTYISILLDDIYFSDGGANTKVSGTIYITTDLNHCLLKGGASRMLEGVDQICQSLDGQKISAAGKITITSASLVVVDVFRAAYAISFNNFDQTSERAAI